MKILISGLMVLMASSVSALELNLGLHREDGKDKPVILIYVSNDRIAPVNSSKMTRISSYLSETFVGRNPRHYLSNEKVLSDADLEFYGKLPAADKTFLKELSENALTATSETATFRESRAIRKAMARANPRYYAGFVSFRNFFQPFPITREREFSIEHCPPRREKDSITPDSTSTQDFAKEAFEFPYADQPLSHLNVLEHALDFVYKTYPPEKHRYILVIKSQGGEGGMALAPHFDSFPYEMNYQKLVSEILKQKDLLLQGQKTLPTHRGTNMRLSKIMAEVAGVKTRAGTTAIDVLKLLSKSPGKFPVVFFDVNELDIPKDIKADNIGTIFYTTQPAPYDLVDYGELFSFVGVETLDLETRMREFLRENLK